MYRQAQEADRRSHWETSGRLFPLGTRRARIPGDNAPEAGLVLTVPPADTVEEDPGIETGAAGRLTLAT